MQVTHLADHLPAVSAFEAAQGPQARADLMALYHADPEQFVEAIGGIEGGEGDAVRSTLREWAQAQPNVWGDQARSYKDR